MLFDFGNDPDVLMDFTLVVNTMNFAFTDFSTGVKFETDYMGKRWCDSEAMLACLHRAINAGIPFFSGEYLAKLTRKDLESVFAGTIEMPMLDERVTLFNEVGRVLVEKYQGRYSRFVRSCAPRLYADGDGLPNFAEFALSRNPNLSSGDDHAVVSISGNQVQFTFKRRKNISGIGLSVSVVSADTLDGAWQTISGNEQLIQEDAQSETVRFSIPLQGKNKMFFRISVRKQ
jgi:hypothetical protein